LAPGGNLVNFRPQGGFAFGAGSQQSVEFARMRGPRIA
jgi:hypothetical protein